jgi:hypothetical protein
VPMSYVDSRPPNCGAGYKLVRVEAELNVSHALKTLRPFSPGTPVTTPAVPPKAGYSAPRALQRLGNNPSILGWRKRAQNLARTAFAFAHCANPLKISESSRLSPSDLISVEVKGRHSAQQKISCSGSKSSKRAELRSRHASILGYALNFLFTEAFQF